MTKGILLECPSKWHLVREVMRIRILVTDMPMNVCQVGQDFGLTVQIATEEVEGCVVFLQHDSAFLSLQRGSTQISLGSGSYSKELQWQFSAKAETPKTWVTIKALASGVPVRQHEIPVVIQPKECASE